MGLEIMENFQTGNINMKDQTQRIGSLIKSTKIDIGIAEKWPYCSGYL